MTFGDLPTGASAAARAIHALYGALNGAGLLVLLVVEGLVVFLAVRYRDTRERPPARAWSERTRRRSQVAWIVGPLALMLLFAGWSLATLDGIAKLPADAEHVQAIGRQWAWEFRYPNGTSSLGELRVPLDRSIVLDVTSKDVAHSVFVPELGIRIDAIPGRVNHDAFRADRAGTYRGVCGEFCGIGHPEMTFRVVAG
jgi:cytochrome c oxidase subunit 2